MMQQIEVVMSSPIRLKESLIRDAEAEAKLFSRTVPKQIEFWAEIGKRISHSITSTELIALVHDLAEVRIETVSSSPIDSTQLFATVETKSNDGSLARELKSHSLYYEASKANPGLIDCVQEDGIRQSGYFRDGEFVKQDQ